MKSYCKRIEEYLKKNDYKYRKTKHWLRHKRTQNKSYYILYNIEKCFFGNGDMGSGHIQRMRNGVYILKYIPGYRSQDVTIDTRKDGNIENALERMFGKL